MMGEVRAILVAALLVVSTAAAGVALGERARPAPTPRPVPSPATVALPVATRSTPPRPSAARSRSRSPRAAPRPGPCGSSPTGGAAVRWDGRAWTIPDPTLWSLAAAQCDGSTMLAVCAGGSLLTVDEERRQMRADRFGIEDLSAVVGAAAVWVVGDTGTPMERSRATEPDARAVCTIDLGTACTLRAVFTEGSAVWVVGSDGTRGGAWRIASGRTDRCGTC